MKLKEQGCGQFDEFYSQGTAPFVGTYGISEQVFEIKE